MNSKQTESVEARRRRKRLSGAIKQSLRELRMQLSLLNFRIGSHLDLKDVDLDCLDLLASHGPLSPTALARRAGLHPATMTGVLDRLERGGWVARERDPTDRRAVVVRALHTRTPELMRLYSGMNSAMDQLCEGYDETELQLLDEFLRRAATAGQTATDELTGAGAGAGA